MLHVLNGDATATVFAGAGISGERLVWRDIVVEGPVPVHAHTPLPERFAYLAERLDIDAAAYARAIEAQTARLAATSRDDEVVLWFEQDLFCAVTLWSLLDWLTRHVPAARLSLVYPACGAQVRGLGAMEPAQLASLFAARQPVTDVARALGVEAWAAYANRHPATAASFIDRPAPALPFVAGAFRCHLGRFPSVANGLNEVESAALDALSRGRRSFDELFREVGAQPRVRRHGMGDLQLAACLRRLTPLVSTERDGLEITARGRAVVAGDEDWLGLQPIDTWLGGVHLCRGRPLWRWDGIVGRLVGPSQGV
ncbi:MAG TPA: hypothetical protein VLA62_13035 [Solirubrobacterales bacterium]|nr:hypothetical protein [Solirubrobacterales bacterium]